MNGAKAFRKSSLWRALVCCVTSVGSHVSTPAQWGAKVFVRTKARFIIFEKCNQAGKGLTIRKIDHVEPLGAG